MLKEYFAANRFPILYINLLLVDGFDSVHAVVATELQDQALKVIDPLEGERSLPLSAFEKSWQVLNNLAIIVRPLRK